MENQNNDNMKSTTGLSFSDLFSYLEDGSAYKDKFEKMPKGLIYYTTRKEVCLLHYCKNESEDVLKAIETTINPMNEKLHEKNLLEFHVFNDEQEYRCLVSSRGSNKIHSVDSNVNDSNYPGIIEHFVSDKYKGYNPKNIATNSFCDTVLLEKRISKDFSPAYLKVVNYFKFDSDNGMLKIDDYRLVSNKNGLPFTESEL